MTTRAALLTPSELAEHLRLNQQPTDRRNT